jgi:DNA-binding NtrC family response regulator
VVLEDDADTAEVIQQIIKTAWIGIEVLLADNPTYALSLIREVNPCAVFMDNTIPSMDAQKFISAVRECQIDLPIALISGSADIAKLAKTLDIHEWLQKPFENSALIRLAEQHCPA